MPYVKNDMKLNPKITLLKLTIDGGDIIFGNKLIDKNGKMYSTTGINNPVKVKEKNPHQA